MVLLVCMCLIEVFLFVFPFSFFNYHCIVLAKPSAEKTDSIGITQISLFLIQLSPEISALA